MPAATKTALAGTQAAFAAALMRESCGVPRAVRSHNSAAPLKRFNIYRNNAFASLTNALRRRYPVVERLVGEDFFRATAREFIAAHPPGSPAGFEYGERFPDFLAAFEPAQSLPYLPEVARLEWLRHAAYHAADAEPMEAATLTEVPPDMLVSLTFQLHPSAGLIASPFPVVSIWHTNAMDRQVRPIGPELDGEAALVLRPRLEVMLLRLGPGGAAFIAALGEGANLDAAADEAAHSSPAFSLAETLGACLAAGAFTGFSFQGEMS